MKRKETISISKNKYTSLMNIKFTISSKGKTNGERTFNFLSKNIIFLRIQSCTRQSRTLVW